MGLHTPHSNKIVVQNLLTTLYLSFADPTMAYRVPFIFVGYDRGARICHRIAIDASRKIPLNVVRTILLDIVPTLVEFQSFSTPSSVGIFHWLFLANRELTEEMIKAYGGERWAKMCIDRWAGSDKDSLAKLKSDNAVNVYAQFFNTIYVGHATCDDCRAGANEDVKQQEKDQKAKRKIRNIDVLVLYSAEYLGKRYDVQKVWEEWMGEGELEVKSVGNGCGHFIAEERPEQTAAAIVKFYQKS